MAKKEQSLGSMIDDLYQRRARRIEAQRAVDEAKAEENRIKQAIIERLKKQKLEGSKGKEATASIKRSVEPRPADWNKTWAYIVKEKAYNLVHQRIAVLAWRELHEAGIQVPGIEPIEVEDLSLTKATR